MLSLLVPLLLMSNASPNFQQSDVRVKAERLQNAKVCCMISMGGGQSHTLSGQQKGCMHLRRKVISGWEKVGEV